MQTLASRSAAVAKNYLMLAGLYPLATSALFQLQWSENNNSWTNPKIIKTTCITNLSMPHPCTARPSNTSCCWGWLWIRLWRIFGMEIFSLACDSKSKIENSPRGGSLLINLVTYPMSTLALKTHIVVGAVAEHRTRHPPRTARYSRYSPLTKIYHTKEIRINQVTNLVDAMPMRRRSKLYLLLKATLSGSLGLWSNSRSCRRYWPLCLRCWRRCLRTIPRCWLQPTCLWSVSHRWSDGGVAWRMWSKLVIAWLTCAGTFGRNDVGGYNFRLHCPIPDWLVGRAQWSTSLLSKFSAGSRAQGHSPTTWRRRRWWRQRRGLLLLVVVEKVIERLWWNKHHPWTIAIGARGHR